MHPATGPFDVIGVGFGPSNLAAAIALDDADRRRGIGLSCCFLERQESFVWHRDMLLPDSGMQISFVKDLVTLRDPTSPFTFINYLHQKGRLEAFINLKSFFPSRIEFNDYLCWVASRFDDRCFYGEEAVSVEAGDVEEDTITSLVVRSRSRSGEEMVRRARNLILAIGGRATIPPVFADLRQDARVFHSSRYLGDLAALRASGRPVHRIAIVGAGQSAAEIALDLHSRLPDAKVDMIVRGATLKPADDTPFVNQIFDPAMTDVVFGQSEAGRQDFLREFRSTNYAVIDADLLTRIYAILYRQRVEGTEHLTLRTRSEVVRAVAQASGVELQVLDGIDRQWTPCRYDAVVLATGYTRDIRHPVLAPLTPYLEDFTIERDYRLRTLPTLKPQIYVQGHSEDTHGLSDTLLSVLAIRSDEIVSSILRDRSRGGVARAARSGQSR